MNLEINIQKNSCKKKKKALQSDSVNHIEAKTLRHKAMHADPRLERAEYTQRESQGKVFVWWVWDSALFTVEVVQRLE